ncbi:hypothetical protein GCM10011578_053330 [Streptomyces fuscichromogenes]|uniref:Transposase n=1 Tax=Streptomyces fuscichromogenes TaxID=1324013 RepID=A0A917XGI0_9ACTN|nr:hypothetical protein GCM10011578_053330 [Streptomyces fuscichromogenes]
MSPHLYDPESVRDRRHRLTLLTTGRGRYRPSGYRGRGGTVRPPFRGRWRNLSVEYQAVNRSHAKIRALVERAIATRKSGRPPYTALLNDPNHGQGCCSKSAS